MHEMSIAMELTDQVTRVARESRVVAVEEVVVELGGMWLVDHASLELAFATAAEGTLAEGAALRLIDVPVKLRCPDCHLVFDLEARSFACPRCREARAEVVAGNDIILRSLTCRAAGEADREGARLP